MNQRKLNQFLSLPVNSNETWQGGTVSMTDVLGAPTADWVDETVLVLWRSALTDIVQAKPISLVGKNRLEGLVDIMLELSTDHDFSFRPARIECNDHELADGLTALLSDSGTAATFAAEMPDWNELMEDLTERLGSAGPPIGSLLDAGCTPQQIREFAEAAAAFYRAGIWDYLEDVDLIKIEAPKPLRFLRYAVVLGAASQTYGLGFYDDAEDHYDLMAQRADPRELSLFSLTFDVPAHSPPADVALWNELNLPLGTGEALPSMSFFSDGAPRRPTPKELDFATVVLKALAATSEEDIDSGRWNKSVECFGKSKMCVLSIPNLLDPPVRQEWMRRGMAPERRGNDRHFKLVQDFIEQHGGEMSLDELNEAINARFTKPMDDFEYPMDTPADRAEALCQQAIESFGRRRIQLARQSLAEDPTHVEASVLLAESTRRADQRIEAFRIAKENGKKQLGSMLEEAVGHFWGIAETRPFMRACQGLAEALHDAGQADEAIGQYQEMLRLNPNDNQGVRYSVMPLLMAHNREPEAIRLLDTYREETAHWHYMKSLVEFRRGGGSATSKKAIRSAFRANEHVVDLLQSTDPPLMPDSYVLGSPEEAAICISEMAEAWGDSEGYVEWMFQEYAVWEREKMKRLRDRKRKQRQKATRGKRRR